MIYFKPQTVLGGFALITLLLAGTAIGRVLEVSFVEALYLSVLLLATFGWMGNRVMLRCANPPASEPEV